MIGELGLPIVFSVIFVIVILTFLVWLVKHNLKTNESERIRSQTALDKERATHQRFFSETVKGSTDALKSLADQIKSTTGLQYKMIDSMSNYTTHVENALDRLERGNRSQWEEHLKQLTALTSLSELNVELKKEVIELRKEIQTKII